MTIAHHQLLMAGGGVPIGPIGTALLSWYEMNDNAASTAIVDSAGFKALAFNGALTNAQAQTGLIGGALRVNNNALPQGCIQLASHADTAFDFTGDVSFTAGGWFKSTLSANPNFTQRYFGRLAGAAADGGWAVVRNSGTSDIRSLIVTNSTTSVSTSTVTITSTNWNFIVFRYDAAADLVKLTVNSTNNTASQSGGVYAGSSPADFSIGRHVIRSTGTMDATGTCVDFDVDAFFVCGASLSDAEVASLYNGGAGRTYADVLANGL